jgi:Ca-activated chloride channel family protein
MGFLAPLALWFAVLGVPIVLMYMLKLRRERAIISSTMLWQQVLHDREANAPWQRLRRNLLLLLQLLALALLVAALARPYATSRAIRGIHGSVTILLDASASMQAVDASPSRFEVARRQAAQILDGLGPRGQVTLIAVGDTPRVLASQSGDLGAARRALAGAQATYAQADWDAALALATAAARYAPAPHTTVILSDGGIGPLDEGIVLPGEVTYVPVGSSAENQFISALSLRDGPDGPQAYVRVSNAGTQPAQVLLRLQVDGRLYDAHQLTLAPGGEQGWAIGDLPLDAQQIEARLESPEGSPDRHDVLPIDDTAWAVRAPDPAAARRTVQLVTPGNTFLERALSLLPDLTPTTLLVTQTLTHAPGMPLDAPAPALSIYDRVVPDRLPETGSLLFIAPPTSTGLFDVTGVLTRTEIVRVERDSPLLRYVDLANVHVAHAQALRSPPWARTLVEAEGGPLLVAGEIGGRRVAVLAFDLHQSDLPLQVAFPILVANLSEWFLPASAIQMPASQAGDEQAAVSPGAAVMLYPQAIGPEGSTPAEIAVTGPAGQRWTYPAGEAVPFAHTEQPGIYAVAERTAAGETIHTTSFAVNLFSEQESRVAPVDELALPTQLGERAESPAAAGRWEGWRWAAIAAWSILALEWGVDHAARLPSRQRAASGRAVHRR